MAGGKGSVGPYDSSVVRVQTKELCVRFTASNWFIRHWDAS